MTADLQDMREAGVRIDICVCTYRRPALEDTLHSIGMLNVPDGATVRIIVADNDAVPSARDLVYRLASLLPFKLSYVHCPASNISLARNACRLIYRMLVTQQPFDEEAYRRGRLSRGR